MINIQNTKTIFYDQDKSQVTVYGDFDDPGKWYIVPAVQFARAAGTELPEFSLLEFDTNAGVQGLCSFTTELVVTPEAVQAVRNALGQGITIAQFDWVSAQAFFNFQIAGEDQTINAVPSRYANNRAAFVITLPDQTWVNTFKAAFGPGQGSLSPFRVDYSVMALSKLPAVTVKVTYDSQIAFDYEKTVKVDRNVWGKETSRRSTIKEQLKQSDAGDTDVNWNVSKPSPEMQQRVLDWAWVTLEGLVEKAVDDAIRFVGEKNADQIQMSATQSFERTYSENQVIEWSILPFAQMPSFDAAQWSQVYKKGDNRSLAVSFTIRDSLAAAKIKSVQVNVKYPTKTTGNSFLFTPTTPTSWTFTADGTAPFTAAYEYQYIVTYEEPGKTYTSPWIPSSDTMVVLPLTALGTQTAVFIGSNIPFDVVDYVLIDFFFNLPSGDNKHEQRKLVDNVTPLPIPSRTYLPSTNEYTYQLTYVMKDGKGVFLVGPQKLFPPQNSDLVTIFSPFQKTRFTLGVVNPPAALAVPRIQYVSLTAQYKDPQNNNFQENLWDFEVPADKTYLQGQPWQINIVQNPGAAIEYNGVLLMSDGDQRPINQIRTSNYAMNFSYKDMPFTAAFDPFQIDWAKVIKVQVDLFTLKDNPSSLADILAAVPERTNIQSLQFMKPEKGAAPSLYYTFLYPSAGSPVYYYQATYYHATGPDTYVKETQSQGQTIVLPKDPTATQKAILRVEHPPAALVAEPLKATA
jgi:hypothetical protein